MKQTQPALVTSSQIAELADVSPSAVSNWRRRLSDFPAPREEAPGGRDLYALTDIKTWLEQTGRIAPDREYAWLMFDASHRLRDVVGGDQIVEVIAAALTLVHLLDKETRRADDTNLRAAVDRLSNLVPNATDIFRPLLELPKSHAEEILELVGHTVANKRAEVLEWVLSKRSRFVDTRSSESLTSLLVDLAVPSGTRLMDPAVGEGGFLLATARHATRELSLFGQELNEAAWRIAQQRLLINDIAADIALGDSLASDAFPDLKVDTVLCDPPYGPRAETAFPGGLWEFGPPEPKIADFAWLQHVIRHLDPNGRGYVLLPTGSLFRGGNAQRVRTELIARKAVEAIVTLPAGAADFTSIPLALWIVRRPDQADQPAEVLIIDATAKSSDGTHTSKRMDSSTIASVLTGWRNGEPLTVPGGELFVATVSGLELLRADANLSPARWVRGATRVDLEVVQQRLRGGHDGIVENFGRLESSGAFSAEIEGVHLSWIPVRDLVEAKLVEIIRSVRVPPEACVADGARALRPRDIGEGSIRTEEPCWVDPDALRPRPALTRAGDIVLSPASGRLNAVVDDVGGHVLASPLQGLRVVGDWMDPALVAALLASPRNRRFAKGTAYARVDIRDVELPSATAAEIQGLPETINAIDDLQKAASELSQAASLMKEGLLERVSYGSDEETGEGQLAHG